jgi:hypothetical protein
MAGEHGCAVIATVGIAIEEYVATALGRMWSKVTGANFPVLGLAML